MSIIWSLKKLFDPMAHNHEEGEKESERQLPEDDDSGDPPRFEMAPAAVVRGKSAPERYRCRICDYIGGGGGDGGDLYCPECLADTMKPVN